MITQSISDVNKNIKVVDDIIAPEVIKRRQLIETLNDDYMQPVSALTR